MESENKNINRYKWTPSGMICSHQGIWYPIQKALSLLLQMTKLEQENTMLFLKLQKYEKQYGKLND